MDRGGGRHLLRRELLLGEVVVQTGQIVWIGIGHLERGAVLFLFEARGVGPTDRRGHGGQRGDALI